MPYTPAFLDRLHKALLSAFSRDDLRQLATLCLDADFDAVVAENGFDAQVFEFVQWARRRDRIEELVVCAQEARPRNRDLAALRREIQGAESRTKAEEQKAPLPKTETAAHHVFLAYSRRDAAIMRRLRADLQAAGLKVWTGEQTQPLTIERRRAVEAGLEQAQCLIVLLSADETVWEQLPARKYNLPTLIVCAENSSKNSVPPKLAAVEYIDARPSLDFSRTIKDKLIPAVLNCLGLDNGASWPFDVAKGLSIDWITVPAGEFLMGAELEHAASETDVQPRQRRVFLPSYQISRVPIPNWQYKLFLDQTGYEAPVRFALENWLIGRESHPVVGVNRYDASMFCRWANVRLPTEAEWEKAARGMDGRTFPWGDAPPTLGLGNFCTGDTAPVGSNPLGESPYGLLDMAGNVWEWTLHYIDANDQLEAQHLGSRGVLRGGSYLSSPDQLRCTVRSISLATSRDCDFGFRVVRLAV